MNLKLALIVSALAAAPAAETSVVHVAAVNDTCAIGTACAVPALPEPPAATPSDTTGAGPIIAGLAGMLVLGLVFGRRKPGLPQVVS